MSVTKDKVSIIIPNFNHAKFLRKRIDSVLNQTYKNFEVIILDDASTDDSCDIIREYESDARVTVIINEVNSGSTFSQWELGLSVAKGDFVWIAESDDYCEVNFLEELVPLMNEHVVIAYCRSVTVDEDDIASDFYWPDKHDASQWQKSYVSLGFDEIKNNLIFRNTIPNASAVVFKKKYVIDVGVPDKMKFCGDWLFWIKILNGNGRHLAYSQKKLNYFRLHKNTTRNTSTRNIEVQRYSECVKVVNFARKLTNMGIRETLNSARNWDWLFCGYLSRSQVLSRCDTVFPKFGLIFFLLYYRFIVRNRLVL